jgi:AbrB family looped-hinge helix DNA binding protein
METKLSTKGQVVLPRQLRRKLGLQPGDSLEAAEENGRLVLTPRHQRGVKLRIATDPITGLPVLQPSRKVPKLTSKEVAEILSNFP